MSALAAVALVVGVLVAWWSVTPAYIGTSRRTFAQRAAFVGCAVAGASVVGVAILRLTEVAG